MKQEMRLKRFVSFDDLPEDIIKDILLRLDVKSLRRFECVCKSWQTLIRQPSFINNHFKRQPSSVILFSAKPDQSSNENDNDFLSSCTALDEIQRCEIPSSLKAQSNDNGVFCLTDGNGSCFWLWNPATTEIKQLPSPPTCEWKKPDYLVGLGYDSSTDDFNVVRVCATDDESVTLFKSDNEFSVYNSRRNSWKRVRMLDQLSSWSDLSSRIRTILGHNYCSTVVNGSIHWLLAFKRDDDIDDDQDWDMIVAFDMRTEVFKLIGLPEIGESDQIDFVGKLSERLSLFVKTGLQVPSIFEIWIMKEYGVPDSWIKQVKVDYARYPLELKTEDTYFSPFALGFRNNCNMLFEADERLYWYDLESDKVTYLCPFDLETAFAFTTAQSIIHI